LKILVVDDHALVREGLCQVLKGLEEHVEVLEAPDCARAFELAHLHPDLDLVLLDYHLPDMNGLLALNVFGKRHPELPIVMLSGSVNPRIMQQVLARGAAAFLTKSGLSHELLTVIRQVLAGDVFVPPAMANSFTPPIQPDIDAVSGFPKLSPRQEEVLLLLLAGRTNREMSEMLELAEETTKSHVTAILRAFGVRTRLQVIVEAGRQGYPISVPST
jgi:DNA-binding NarL/FixJ family response regulator